ncbi:ThiF family adenylyltransferase [Cellulomonas sp. PSBB021]|uniref:HesA/MoeB/ThiF family protein n=1 Tax=Cellulomonas sp. PSBB021 TaxID=2003551 RepID=UPI000B8D954C|nr:ThiF family adenylyltransferase [Cellulomonas sp. PSBB021]ASR56048.1 thiamine biosynthesis protein ThiF [Cellulomonas sp. PSBB021]
MLPRLKSLNCLAGDGELIVSLDPRVRTRVADPDGQVLALLTLLRDGTRDVPALAAALRERHPAVTPADVAAAVAQLDRLGWLEDAAAPQTSDAHDRERYFSNLAFFDAFTTLSVPREQPQSRLRDAHVLVLGAGGLGSSVLMNLAGLGVGAVTVVDQDRVELRNFARQFTYTEAEVGQPKAERVAAWLRAFDPTLRVEAFRRRVESPDDVTALLRGSALSALPSLVVSAIDEPDEVDRWVNEACVAAGVPFIRGGLAYTQGLYWSVDPGVSACRECLERHRARLADGIDREVVERPRVLEQDRVNRAIGPVTSVLGGLVSLEAMRFLTGLTAPVSLGRYQLVDFAGDGGTTSDAWPADPDCPVCATAPARAAARAAVA